MTKNDYGRPEFVTKLSEWQPKIFYYPDAEIYSFQLLRVDFHKLPLKMAIHIKHFKKTIIGTLALLIFDRNLIWPCRFRLLLIFYQFPFLKHVEVCDRGERASGKIFTKDCQKEYELHRRTLLVESEPDLVDDQPEIAAIEREEE